MTLVVPLRRAIGLRLGWKVGYFDQDLHRVPGKVISEEYS